MTLLCICALAACGEASSSPDTSVPALPTVTPGTAAPNIAVSSATTGTSTETTVTGVVQTIADDHITLNDTIYTRTTATIVTNGQNLAVGVPVTMQVIVQPDDTRLITRLTLSASVPVVQNQDNSGKDKGKGKDKGGDKH